MDHRVFLFAFLVSVVTAGLCGLVPALQTGRIPLIASLKERSRIATAGGVRLRKALVVGQMAFTLILLIGAGLFVQTLARLHAKGPDSPAAVCSCSASIRRRNGYSDADAKRVMRDLFRRLQDAPGVEQRRGGEHSPADRRERRAASMTIQSDERIVTDRRVS